MTQVPQISFPSTVKPAGVIPIPPTVAKPGSARSELRLTTQPASTVKSVYSFPPLEVVQVIVCGAAIVDE